MTTTILRKPPRLLQDRTLPYAKRNRDWLCVAALTGDDYVAFADDMLERGLDEYGLHAVTSTYRLDEAIARAVRDPNATESVKNAKPTSLPKGVTDTYWSQQHSLLATVDDDGLDFRVWCHLPYVESDDEDAPADAETKGSTKNSTKDSDTQVKTPEQA
jgi:hypothetical protein